MNELIKEFVEKSGGYYLPPNTPLNKPAHIFLEDEQVEKFAELIIRECYEHCKDQLMDEMIIEAIGLTYNDGVGDCAIGLLQHFGVEE